MDPNQSTQQPIQPASPTSQLITPVSTGETPVEQKTNHNKLVAIVIIVLGILEALFMGIMLFLVIPQMDVLYKNLNVNSSLPTTLVYILEIIFVIQIIAGVLLLIIKSVQVKNTLSKIAIAISIIGVLGLVVTLPKIIYSTISPIYNLTSSINEPITPPVTKKLSPTPDLYAEASRSATANWKTYTNKKYGFSFKYPDGWTYDDSGSLGENSEKRKSGYQLLLGPENTGSHSKNDPKTMGQININIFNKENYAFYSPNVDGYHAKPYTTKKVTLNNLTLTEIHHSSCPTNDDCISVIFKSGENIFVFDTWVWSERYKDLDTIYQILSTFKFTN